MQHNIKLQFYDTLGVDSLRTVLLGAPGVGKGTQAKLICESFTIPHISTGDMFRKHISEGTDLGLEAENYIKTGKLVPDELTISIVKDRLGKQDCSSGFLLDGFPRNLLQAKELDLFLFAQKQCIDKVILIDSPKHTLIDRISGRRFCTNCGSSYHIIHNPSKSGGMCELCGEKLIQRPDDMEDVVLDRLTIYYKTIKPILDYYNFHGMLYKIQGSESINDVFNNIRSTLRAV